MKRYNKKECIAMLLAGGQGSRLGALTKKIAKPAVSFGGKYRIIDFSLSNCTNSDIDTVGVLTQYKPMLLNSYLGTGAAWDLDNDDGGVHTLPPYATESGGKWYKGTADAIFQNLDYISQYNPEYVLIISGDHLYKMDYREMLKTHKDNKSDLTISVLNVSLEEASRFGILTADDNGKITKFTEKPKKPDSTLASMGIYIFNWKVLKEALLKDSQDESSDNDFGKNVIPALLSQGKRLFVHKYEGYWRDVGTIESYYNANMELLNDTPQFDVFDMDMPVFSNSNIYPPQYVGKRASIKNSLVSNGCVVLGSVRNSIISPEVYIGEGAVVEASILLPGARVEKNAIVSRSIVGENAVVAKGAVMGSAEENSEIVLIGDNAHFKAAESSIKETPKIKTKMKVAKLGNYQNTGERAVGGAKNG